jgi:hypothetical protein
MVAAVAICDPQVASMLASSAVCCFGEEHLVRNMITKGGGAVCRAVLPEWAVC